MDLASVDLTNLDVWADGPPYELFARMRTEAPVRWNPSAEGNGFWSLTRAADIAAVSEDSQTFSSARGGIFLSPDALAPLEFARNFPIYKDPPEHGTYRDIVAQAFSPRAMKLLDQDVRQCTTEAITTVLAGGSTGQCDLVTDIAAPIPVNVIGRMMGAPDEHADTLQTWTQHIEEGMTYGRDVTPTFQEMADYCMGLVNKSRTPGVENLCKSIRQAEIEGRTLTDEEIAVYLGMLLYAGNEPTRSAIAAGLLALIEHPDQMELLRQQPGLLKPLRSGEPPGALAEILRWTSPIGYFARTATTDTTIGGVAIKQGDRVVMWYHSANRDPDATANPDTFDVTRNVTEFRQFSFGGGGAHHCQGDFLASKMVCIALQETIKRLGDLEIAGELTQVRSAFAHSLTSLPVSFRPATEPRPTPAAPQSHGAAPLAGTTAAHAPTPTPAAAPPAEPEPAAAQPATHHTSAKPGLFKRLFGKS